MDAVEIAKEVRAELKKEFPGYKFSVTADYSSMTIALMEAPESPVAYTTPENMFSKYGYEQLNHHYLDCYSAEDRRWNNTTDRIILTPKAIALFKKITKIANRKNYDNSDIQTDHFDVGYYFNLHIGKWNKPFQVK